MFGHWNAWTACTNKKGWFGSIEFWLNKEGIANIFSIPKLKDMGFYITYNSRDGRYIVYTEDGTFMFNKDEMGLPHIDAKKTKDVAFIQTV